jgi:hypothetical protein
MKFRSILIFSLFLAGCTATTAVVINPQQVYRGYPCNQHCDAFKKGFDSAEQIFLKDASLCRGTTLEEKSGCQAYVLENSRTTPTFTDLTIK